MAEKLDEETLKALLADEIRAAQNYDESELSPKRVRAMEYYQGEMSDTPPRVGGSQVVSRDVADTIGWMLPGIIRVFTSSDRMAVYEAVEPKDVEFVEQATDYANHIFWKDNPGYRILWDATHDSLTQGNGIVKHWWDDKEECSYSEHTGLTVEQITVMQQDGGAVVSAKPGEPQKIMVPTPDGQMVEQEIETFDIKLKRVTRSGTMRLKCIKPEDFLINSTLGIEEARFVAHRDEITRSDLVEMGFDREIVENLPAYRITSVSSEEKSVRGEDAKDNYDVGHDVTSLVEVYECYVKADADGDGIAETIRAFYAGKSGSGELLDWEVWDDDYPFSDIPCEPVPHRWDARSVSDETMDVQRIKTVLTRGLLENVYATNVPMKEVEAESVLNPEMLSSPKFGGIIWRKKGTIGTAPILPHVVPFVGDKVLAVLEHLNVVLEKRTGVSRSTMALDPETLQNQTATANQNQHDAAYSQIELIARNQAELGWKRVFQQILKLIVKHQDRPRTIRLRDEFVTMDPRPWNANMDATVNTGLGTGSRDRDMAMLNVVLTNQVALTDRLVGGGFADKAIEMIPKIRNTLLKMAEAAGIRNPEDYYPEIDEPQLEEMKKSAGQREDPKIAIEKQKLQADMQRGQAEMQMDQAKNQQDTALAAQKMEYDIILQREKMQGELMLKREQLIAEMELKREQLGAELMLKRELSMQEMQMKREQGFYQADASAEVGKYKADATSGVHVGGDPG